MVLRLGMVFPVSMWEICADEHPTSSASFSCVMFFFFLSVFSRVPKKDSVFCNWGCSWWKLRDELLELMADTDSYQGKHFHYLDGSALKRAGFVKN